MKLAIPEFMKKEWLSFSFASCLPLFSDVYAVEKEIAEIAYSSFLLHALTHRKYIRGKGLAVEGVIASMISLPSFQTTHLVRQAFLT